MMKIIIILYAVIQSRMDKSSAVDINASIVHTPDTSPTKLFPDTRNEIPIDTTCPDECVSAMKQLQLQQSQDTICCWMYSTDKSHRIYIDVNMGKQLGHGTWATVYDVQMHYQVE